MVSTPSPLNVADWWKSKALELTVLDLCPSLPHSHMILRKSFSFSPSHSLISKKEIIIVFACINLGPVRIQKPHSELNRGSSSKEVLNLDRWIRRSEENATGYPKAEGSFPRKDKQDGEAFPEAGVQTWMRRYGCSLWDGREVRRAVWPSAGPQ